MQEHYGDKLVGEVASAGALRQERPLRAEDAKTSRDQLHSALYTEC